MSEAIMNRAVGAWRRNVWAKQHEIDPHDDMEWSTLAHGFMLGLGLTNEEAEEVVCELDRMKLL